MTVFKRNGTYHYDFVIRGSRYRGTTHMTNKSDATQYESDRRQEAKDGLLGRKKVPRFRDYSKRWLDEIESSSLDRDTKKYYKNGIRLCLAGGGDKQTIAEITHGIFDKIHGSSSRNCAVRTLRRILKAAQREGYINRLPEFTLAKEKERDTIIEKDTADKIVAMAPQPLRDVFMLLYDTGMRPEEVYRMETRLIDWGNRTYFNERGKTKSSRRLIALSDRVLDMLVVRCADKKVRKSGWVFPARNTQSTSGHVSNVARQWCSVRKTLGLSSETVLYSARHTFGTAIYGATGNLKATMAQMGHNDLKTAMRYQHPKHVDVVHEVINKLNLGGKEKRVM